ncbi:sulfotransferase family protein [Flexithrix dorotheae]|uniref:sulfotransferase family protein n=1 Tax=Flexithrix dorotheae TaxID=70993 RepID=UPI00036DF7F6|nr:sulfotransferase family protein [Flexithrix dorotheae]
MKHLIFNTTALIKLYSSYHRANGEKNIFLFSTPRSGSTWLTELIHTQPQFRMIKEPFNLRKGYVRDNLKMDNWEDLINPVNQKSIEKYINHFIQGKDNDLRFPRFAPFRPLWKPFTSRIIFKILFAGEGEFNWFKKKFNGEIIFLIRHPIPVSLSRKVCPRIESFLQKPYINHFSVEQKKFSQEILKKGDHFEMAILDWCFQNALPLRQMDQSWLTVSYEQTVLQPEIVIQNLVSKFQFPKPEKITNRLNKASVSTGKSSRESQNILLDPQKLAKNKRWLVEKWRDKITDNQHQKAFEILNVFGIDFYEYKNFGPKKSYLLK